MPKFTAFAQAAHLGVTSQMGTPNAREAVAAWKSAPLVNAWMRLSSPDQCASRRSWIVRVGRTNLPARLKRHEALAIRRPNCVARECVQGAGLTRTNAPWW